MVNKLALSILVSIILTIIIVSLANVGIALFMDEPKYNEFCDFKTQEVIENQERCEEIGGKWNPEGKTFPREIREPEAIQLDDQGNVIAGYCDRNYECTKEWESAYESFNQKRFYVFALLGFVLLLTGLFSKENLVQITGLAAGGILVFEGIVTNWESEAIVFVALLLILIVFGVVANRVIKKKD
jgi:hypothetical protein